MDGGGVEAYLGIFFFLSTALKSLYKVSKYRNNAFEECDRVPGSVPPFYLQRYGVDPNLHRWKTRLKMQMLCRAIE